MKLATTITRLDREINTIEPAIENVLLTAPKGDVIWYITIHNKKYFVSSQEDFIHEFYIERKLKLTPLEQ